MGATSVATGDSFTLALKSDGTVWAWGSNSYGQFGNGITLGTIASNSTPVQVSDFSGVIAIAAGEANSLALKADGTVWAWGSNSYGQFGNGITLGTIASNSTPVQVSDFSGVIAIAAGEANSLALKADGTVWAWGSNSYGQLGNGTTSDSSTPVQVMGLSGVIAIASGGYHSLALKSDGTVWDWGYNIDGELGTGPP